jgi:hypothetical protein
MGDKRKMTEEEYFRKNYPDSCYGDKPLSPHWDFFQDGAEFGYNKGKREAKEIIRSLLFHLSKDTFTVIYETKEESIKRAEQFLMEEEK